MNFKEMSITELRELAKEQGIKNISKLKKELMASGNVLIISMIQ